MSISFAGVFACGSAGGEDDDLDCGSSVEAPCPSDDEAIPAGDEVVCNVASTPPSSLLDTCFSRIQSGQIAANLRPFVPRFEQYADGSTIRRWVYLPPGSSIAVDDVDSWEFPTGSVFWQELTAEARAETRMLEKISAGVGASAWRASTYLWTTDQQDAHLSLDGHGPRPDHDYVVGLQPTHEVATPDTCNGCHESQDDMVLGFGAIQLSDAELPGNIDSWSAAGYIDATQSRVAMVGSELDQEVLGYMHANCGTCHSDRGAASHLEMNLSYSVAGSTELVTTNVFQTAVYQQMLVVPGSSGDSRIYNRFGNAEMPPASVARLRDDRFYARLRQWIYGLESIATIVDDTLPLVIEADEPGKEMLGYQASQDDAVRGTVFVRRDAMQLRSRIAVPIDTNKTYRISGRFKSDAATPSILYFGVAPYDEDLNLIWDYQANRVGSAAVVDPSQSTSTVLVTKAPVADWNVAPSPGYMRAIGFYFDGDTQHLPDYVHFAQDGDFAAYDAPKGSSLPLNVELPDDVLAALTSNTKIMNHHFGGTYLYTAAGHETVGSQWTEYSGEISGEAFAGGDATFRPGTRYARLLLLLNFQQDGLGARILFDDLRIEEVPAGEASP